MNAALTKAERAELSELRWLVRQKHREMISSALATMANPRGVVIDPVPIHLGGFVVFEDNVFAVDTEDGETPTLRPLGL